ncbi:MAG: hypothetical protein MZU95_13305 [Desulfomicrobium escambiense]|nr:hypothetical protein [Desulfomicrobium escambiense]
MENQEKSDVEPVVEEVRRSSRGRTSKTPSAWPSTRLKLPRTEFDYEVVTEKTRLFGLKGKEIVIRAWTKDEGADNRGDVTASLDRAHERLPAGADLRHQDQRTEITFVVFGGADKTAALCEGRRPARWPSSTSSTRSLDGQGPGGLRVLPEAQGEVAPRLRPATSPAGFPNRDGTRSSDLMNPYERRIVHIAANEVPGVTSESLPGTGS